VRLEVREGPAPVLHGVGERSAAFPLLGGGWALLDRDAGTAVRGDGAAVDPTVPTHQVLAAVGAVHAWWAGRPALHAGAVLVGDGAWLVAAPSEGGKSSTLAAFAQRGVPVLADDLAVLDVAADGAVHVLAGPRSIDLRSDAAVALGVDARPVRGATRRRLRLGHGVSRAPVVGIAHLAWSDGAHEASADPVAPSDRLALLLREDLWSMPPRSPESPLALAALPAVRVRRARHPGSLAGTVDALRALR
jgi:hypothetical protein